MCISRICASARAVTSQWDSPPSRKKHTASFPSSLGGGSDGMPNPWMLMFDSFAISSSGAIGWLTLDARIRRSAMNLSIFILFSLSSSDLYCSGISFHIFEVERRQTYVLSGEEYQTHPHQPILALGLRLGPPDGLSSAWRWDWHDGCLVQIS